MTVKMEATTEEKQAISHKGENRKDYTMQFKKEKKLSSVKMTQM